MCIRAAIRSTKQMTPLPSGQPAHVTGTAPRCPPRSPLLLWPPPGQFCTTFMMPPPSRSSCTASAYFSCPPIRRSRHRSRWGFHRFLRHPQVTHAAHTSRLTPLWPASVFTPHPASCRPMSQSKWNCRAHRPCPPPTFRRRRHRKSKWKFQHRPDQSGGYLRAGRGSENGHHQRTSARHRQPGLPPVIGRFRFLPAAGAFLPPVREFRAVSRTLCGDPSLPCQIQASQQTYANGLIAGQYHAPNFEFIFPENIILGDRVVSGKFARLRFPVLRFRPTHHT